MFRHPLLNDFVSLRDTVDRLVGETLHDDPFRTLWSRSSNGGVVAQPMAIDVYTTDDRAVILAAVPGMRPQDLDLSVHENTVMISGKIADASESTETKGATWYVHELWSGEVRRSVTMPFAVDAERADAQFEDGILRITLPKADSAKPRKISIGTGGQSQNALTEGTNTKKKG
jgi:HSP20 family protein